PRHSHSREDPNREGDARGGGPDGRRERETTEEEGRGAAPPPHPRAGRASALLPSATNCSHVQDRFPARRTPRTRNRRAESESERIAEIMISEMDSLKEERERE